MDSEHSYIQNHDVHVSNLDKWRYSLYAAIVFVLVSLPATYKITNALGLGTVNSKGGPSALGIGLHTIVFFLLIRIAMVLP